MIWALTLGLLLQQQEPAAAEPWRVLRPHALRASSGAELHLREDGSILAKGASAPTDVYELEITAESSGVVALRLEALPDLSLPLSGAARSANSNLCITEIELLVSSPNSRKKPQAVNFRGVHQTRGDRGTGRRLVDGNRSSYWVVHGTAGEPSIVVLLTETPVTLDKGATLTVRIRQESPYTDHALGRFRLAITEDLAAADAYAPLLDPLAMRADQATWKGIQFLMQRQHPDGTWFHALEPHHASGMTSLCAYALFKAGMPRAHADFQLALAYLETHPPQYTYDAALRIMLYTSLDSERWRSQIEAAAEILLYTPDNYFTYVYAGGQASGGDLSNHQFATVALHALDDHGFKLDRKLWERIAGRIVANQNPDGSFGYYPGSGSTPTMSLAGLSVLASCRNAYERSGAPRKDLEVLRRALEKGVAYCGKNWLLDQPRNVGPLDRWFLYACYGMERAAALVGTDVFGEHDWYAEVGTEICDLQNGDGSWTDPWGENEMNTAFALLTLARATAATGLPSITARFSPRWSNAGTGAEFALTAVGAPEAQVFLAGFGKKIVEDFAWDGEARPRILQVQWLLNGVPVGEPVAATTDPAAAARGLAMPRFPADISLPGNGDYELCAVASMIPPGLGLAEAEEIRSAPLRLEVRGLLDPKMQAEMASMRGEAWVVAPEFRELKSSSHFNDGQTGPQLAFDRAQSTRWCCATGDAEPWIRAEWKRGVAVKALRLLPVLHSAHLADGTGFDCPRQVLLILNDKEEHRLEFTPADVVSGITVTLERKMNLRSVEIRILKRDPGSEQPGLAGWREIQFFAP